MKDIYITWDDYHKKIEQLAKKVVVVVKFFLDKHWNILR